MGSVPSFSSFSELMKELDEMTKYFFGDVAVTKALQALRSACEAALIADEALFCFAD